LDQHKESEFDQAREIVRNESEFVGDQAAQASKRPGIDLITNKPLLRKGDEFVPVDFLKNPHILFLSRFCEALLAVRAANSTMHLSEGDAMSSYSNPFPVPFNADDQRPLPELIAQGNPDPIDGWPAFSLQSHDVEGIRHYAVQDWILGVAHSDSPRNLWQRMKMRLSKARIQLSPPCSQLPYVASNGRSYDMDFASAETLYQITQRMDANTGVRDRVLRYLAKAGVIVDEARLDPNSLLGKAFGPNPDLMFEAGIQMYREQGKSDAWIVARLLGVQSRKIFTAAFQQSLRQPPNKGQYALITDTVRMGVWKRNTAKIKKELGLPEKGNVRDNLPLLALSYELLAENLSAAALDQQKDLEFDQAREIVRNESEFVGDQAAQASKRLGIDLITNKPLLRKGDE
jgi:hypothetical protein